MARGLPTGTVEKDFWVTVTLRELFSMPDLADHLTFKGGTSLSKAWGLLDRFSEDIDLTLDRGFLGFGGDQDPEQAISRNEQRRRLEALKLACRGHVQETIAPALSARFERVIRRGEEWRITADEGEMTLLFAFPGSETLGTARYITPTVKLEFGARSDPWPIEERTVSAIVAEEFPALFDAPGAFVRALRPERTFLEKAMLLHEETFRPPERPRPVGMARHYYDVARLIQAGVAARAADDPVLFRRVAEHRQIYFRQNWVDYKTLRRGSLRLMPPAAHEASWRTDYDAMRGEMFTGAPPTFDEILATVLDFERAFNRG